MGRVTLGEKIRELREQLDLSLRELGKQLNDTSAAFLSDVELGRRFPTDKLLADMARALKTTPAELKKYDTRAPIDALKRLANSDPAFGLALRRVVDQQISADELMRLANRVRGKAK